MKHTIIFLNLILFIQCKALINVKVPPITITNAQTAAEKQMVGEDRELEKDGWLLSSIQSSSNGSQSMAKESEGLDSKDSLEYGHYQRLIYLNPEVRKFKFHGMIGETPGAILKLNPESKSLPHYADYQIPEKSKRVLDVIQLTNESRKILIEKQIDLERKKGGTEEEIVKLKQNLQDSYLKNVNKGEFFENKSGKWERMP